MRPSQLARPRSPAHLLPLALAAVLAACRAAEEREPAADGPGRHAGVTASGAEPVAEGASSAGVGETAAATPEQAPAEPAPSASGSGGVAYRKKLQASATVYSHGGGGAYRGPGDSVPPRNSIPLLSDLSIGTGSDPYFLGFQSPAGGLDQGAARAATDLDAFLAACLRRPDETPADMFFRFWGDNPFEETRLDALSTFAVDVDTASYSLARRYVRDGHLPEREQVRTEEFVNYFRPDVPPPAEDTFALQLDLAPSPFGDPASNPWLLRVAVRGREVARTERDPLVLTFVLDVSGSMERGGRLELVKHALRLLAAELDARDTVSLIAFANEARLVLPAQTAASRAAFETAIEELAPSGGTNAEAGLLMGYEQALAAFAEGAVNRVVLLSDGVANIGETDQDRITEAVARHREQGVYLNTIGVGLGNHDDEFLEQLADRGDGLCAYVDTPAEARRHLVHDFTGTFQPIAREAKIQVEFDPAQIERYRLLGYENRALADADFRDDEVDAGEVGAGHQVTALYELVRHATGPDPGRPLATARLRWEPPGGGEVQELERGIGARDASGTWEGTLAGFRRAALVAQYAELLRRSAHARGDTFADLLAEIGRLEPELADPEFTEFRELVSLAAALEPLQVGAEDELLRAVHTLYGYHYLRALLEDAGEGASAREGHDGEREALEAELRRVLEERSGQGK